MALKSIKFLGQILSQGIRSSPEYSVLRTLASKCPPSKPTNDKCGKPSGKQNTEKPKCCPPSCCPPDCVCNQPSKPSPCKSAPASSAPKLECPPKAKDNKCPKPKGKENKFKCPPPCPSTKSSSSKSETSACPPAKSKSSACPPPKSNASACPPPKSKSSSCAPPKSKTSACPPPKSKSSSCSSSKPKAASSSSSCPPKEDKCAAKEKESKCGSKKSSDPCAEAKNKEGCLSPAIAGKVAIITGGSVGIGYYCALAILRNGGKVMLGDVKVDEGKEAICKIIDEFGYNKAAFIKCDVTQPKDMECLFNAALCEFKQIDIVINNAGILMDQYWEKCIDINAKGLVRGTLMGFNHMRRNKGGGQIINVASILGHQPFHGAPIYTGTKHFVIGFSRSMGSDYYFCQTGVKVMTLCPGVTITSMVENSDTAGQLEGFGDTGKELHDALYSLPTQSGEACGMHIVPMLEAGINGSDWISEADEVYRVRRVDRLTLRIDDKC